jgi:ABC-type hemin transport system ATPase subunit
MITVRDVDVRVGARLLLSGVSFHVSPGDRIGLVGRNGAGKTTLLHTLAGAVTSAISRRSRARPTSRSPSPTGSCPRAAWTTPYGRCAAPRPRWPTERSGR